MMKFSSLAVLSALPLALAGLFDSPQPLLAFSHPRSFLGLKDEFTKRIDMVAFIPGFHPCGTLNIFALDERSLEYSDFDLLPRSNETIPEEEGQEVARTLKDYYEEAKDSVMEEAALEGTVLSWARGWRNTCGKGAVNKQVKIVKISADGMKAGASREDWVKALREFLPTDARIAPHLANLEPAPHNNLVIVTPISPSTQRLLFDVATPSRPSPGKPSDHDNSNLPPGWSRRRERPGLASRIAARLIDLTITTAFFAGLFYAGRFGWRKYQARKEVVEGEIRLPQ